ncbi:MAG: ABC transporter substrate-binding protein [Deltaproteobacteria bacterium]|jgi:iron complex transport system substrate-binding protein|nr:ABC transporter substrate-binding protein [Deltaproteobacteria bacterium]
MPEKLRLPPRPAALAALLLLLLLRPVPARGYARIITLGAPAVEIVFALGLGEAVIARGKWDLWPPAARALPQVGTASQLNLELILSLKPDLLVADRSFAGAAGRLAGRSIPVFTFSAYNTQEVIPAVLLLAEKLGREERGRELAAELASMLELAERRLAPLPPEKRPGVLALAGTRAYYSFSDRSGWRFVEFSGGRNLCADWESAFPSITPEWLAAARPDFVLLYPYRTDYAEDEREAFLRKTWEETRSGGHLSKVEAVRQGRLVVLDDLLTFGLRSVPGVLFLSKKLHPELFADLDAEALHREFLLKYFAYSPRGGHIYPGFEPRRETCAP